MKKSGAIYPAPAGIRPKPVVTMAPTTSAATHITHTRGITYASNSSNASGTAPTRRAASSTSTTGAAGTSGVTGATGRSAVQRVPSRPMAGGLANPAAPTARSAHPTQAAQAVRAVQTTQAVHAAQLAQAGGLAQVSHASQATQATQATAASHVSQVSRATPTHLTTPNASMASKVGADGAVPVASVAAVPVAQVTPVAQGAPMAQVAPVAAVAVPASKPKKKRESNSNDVPIFLQKTYHMIDTCDPNICCWSEDGLTFIVKNPTLFETTIIPQFFKHSKFSSFVRQLNFYGFRKIKYSDSLRIDLQMEARTANYWRFRHDKFRRGRTDLLGEIKRSSGSNNSNANSSNASQVQQPGVVGVAGPAVLTAPSSASGAVLPAPVLSSAAVATAALAAPAAQARTLQATQAQEHQKPEEVTTLKTEVQELKQRIASMTKNIDDLTSMVKSISVKDEADGEGEETASGVTTNNKRKKMEGASNAKSTAAAALVKPEDIVMQYANTNLPDWTSSHEAFPPLLDAALPEAQLSAQLPPLAPLAPLAPLPEMPLSRDTSLSPSLSPPSSISDEAFVDDLFQAFADEGMDVSDLELLDLDSTRSCSPIAHSAPSVANAIEDTQGNAAYTASSHASNSSSSSVNANAPDPQLMKRIEDSLATIPKAMHDMVADRIVEAIANTQPIAQSASLVDVDADHVYTQYHGQACPLSPKSLGNVEEEACSVSQADVEVTPDANVGVGASGVEAPISLPLAVATLRTILAEYGVSVECRREVKEERLTKSLPVVPMHA